MYFWGVLSAYAAATARPRCILIPTGYHWRVLMAFRANRYHIYPDWIDWHSVNAMLQYNCLRGTWISPICTEFILLSSHPHGQIFVVQGTSVVQNYPKCLNYRVNDLPFSVRNEMDFARSMAWYGRGHIAMFRKYVTYNIPATTRLLSVRVWCHARRKLWWRIAFNLKCSQVETRTLCYGSMSDCPCIVSEGVWAVEHSSL